MPAHLLAIAAVFLLTAAVGSGHPHTAGDPADRGDPAHQLAADLALTLQYRAALLFLHSEGARRVVQLLRRPPDTSDVSDSLLREAGLRRLGGPLVVRRRADWARLDRWGKQAAPDVAVLVQDEELLAEAIGHSLASRWRQSFWYAPGLQQGGVLEKLGFAHKFKILTSAVVDGSKQNWTVSQADNSTLVTGANLGMKTNDIGEFNTSSGGRSSTITDSQSDANLSAPAANSTSPSVSIVLRWAPPLSPSQSPLLQMMRASPWLVAGVYRPGQSTVQPAAALLVQRSVLRSQLRAAGCAAWRAELRAADPLTGEPLRQSYTSDSLPVVVTLQGGGPLRVAVRCPALGATLRCRVDLERQTCRWAELGAGRRRRAAGQGYGRQQSAAGWQPSRRAARTDRDYRHRTGQTATDVWRVAPVQQQPEDATEEPNQHRPSRRHQTEPAVQYQQHALANTHRAGVAPVDYNDAAYRQYNDDTYIGNYGAVSYPGEHSGDNYPTAHHGHAQRRQDSAERRVKMLSEDIQLAVWPSFSSCGGAIAGCMTCVSLLTVLNVGVPAAACIGPCSIGGGTACTGAIGTLYREVRKARIAMARKRRRQLSARSQRRLGRLGISRRPQRHL